MASLHVDTKPEKRHKASSAEWNEIRAAFTDACCVSCGLRAESLHHAVSKSRGGSDVVENMVPLCGDGTRGCHGRLESHGPLWRQTAAHVRAFIMSRESRYGYVLGKLGRDLFDRTYPAPPQLGVGDLDRYRQPDATLREDAA